jgi:sec-independent protein translocase protein TatC
MEQDAAQHDHARTRGDAGEMSFLDHLEELRWRIIYSLIGIIAGAIAVWFFRDRIMDGMLLRPALDAKLKLQNLRPFGQVFLYMEVAVFGGLVVSMPNTILQAWKFIAPGLYPRERRTAVWVVLFTTLCFASGIAFAYLAILPTAFRFFAAFGTKAIENSIAIDYYFEFLLTLMLATGLVFEMPMLSFFLARLGLLTPELMRRYWRHAMVVSFFLAAILSPGPDPFSMLLLAIPLVFLYELSVWIARFSARRRRAED